MGTLQSSSVFVEETGIYIGGTNPITDDPAQIRVRLLHAGTRASTLDGKLSGWQAVV